jgi:hypothetical protein
MPIRFITLLCLATVVFWAAHGTDGVTKRLAESIGDATGATVLVENKPASTEISRRCRY